MHRKIYLFVFAALVGFGPSTRADSPAGKRPITFADLMAMQRVGEPVPSPDGKWVAFDAVEVNLGENTKSTHLWVVPASGGDAHRLNPSSKHDESRPRFSPDGSRLIFTSKAGDEPQVWITGFDAGEGVCKGPSHALTALSTGGDGAVWSPDGKREVFVSEV